MKKVENNYIYQYYQAIKDGSEIVGEKIKALYNMIMEGLENKSFFYDKKKADRAIKYIENFCHHHEGELAPQLLKLELWQKANISLIFGIVDDKGNRQFREVVWIVGRKNGKAVSLDTEIPTPTGFKLMKDIALGDYVFSVDGEPTRVEYVSPIFNKPMYLVEFEDGAKVKASADHLWSVQTKHTRRLAAYEPKTSKTRYAYVQLDGDYKTITTEEMVGDFVRERVDGKGKEYKYRVPINKAVQYAEKNLPIEPYLLGVWLGDGNSRGQDISVDIKDKDELIYNLSHSTRYRIECYQKESDAKRGSNVYTVYVDRHGKGYNQSNKCGDSFRTHLAGMDLLQNKHIPEEYMLASVYQRYELLKGLMDTDGTCSKGGQAEFVQKNHRLALQVKELCESLGIKASLNSKKAYCNGKDAGTVWRVTFYTDKKHSCFKFKRKTANLKDALSKRMLCKSIVNITPIGTEPSKCIMVDNPSHLYLVGRDYTATHNTLLASAIASYCLYADGEYGARVYFAAPRLQQADLCFSAMWQSIIHEPELEEKTKKRKSDIYISESNSSAAPLAFSSKRSDGFNISCCISDEVASWQGDAGLKFYEVIKSSFGARKQPLLLSITTAGYINDGVYDELMKRCTAVLNGDSREKRLLPIIYQIDDEGKWNDINELKKSMPNLGISVSVDYMLEEIAIAEGSYSKKVEFMTKYCCIKQNSSTAWLPSKFIVKASVDDIKLEDFRKTYCVLGVDLAESVDLNAVSCIIERDDKLNIFTKFWLPTNRIEEATQRDQIMYQKYIDLDILRLSGESFVDYNDVFMWIVELVEKYQIYPLKCGYDRRSATYFVQQCKQYGIHMDDVYQGDNLWNTMQMFEVALRDEKVNIGHNQLLQMHLLDSAVKHNEERGRGRLVKIYPNAHIDGTASILDAMVMREKYAYEIGEQLKNKGR